MNEITPNELATDFSSRLKKLIAGPSKSRVAKEVGVSRQALTKWVNAQSIPQKKHLDKLASTLNTTNQYLIYGMREDKIKSLNSIQNFQHPFSKLVPKLDWQELINLKNLDLSLCIENHPTEWTTKNTGDRSYALKIDDQHDLAFEKGTVITVDLDACLV